MRNRKRLVLLVVIFAALGGVAYKVVESIWTMTAREIKKNPLKALDYVPEAALQMNDFRRSKIEDGRKVWDLYGDEARYLKEQQEAIITKPRFYFYDKKGETIEVTGDKARLYMTEKELDRMQIQGGVRMIYQGFVLRSEEAFYYPSKDQMLLPGKVTVVGDGLELEGEKMEVALQEQKIRLLQNVKTKVQPEKLEKSKNKSGATEARGG
jgi:LPS export ABC transporter protein LptC